MCELFAMSSRFPANVNLSIGRFAEHGSPAHGHVDGWGVAYCEDGDARVFREVDPAGESPLMRFVCHHGLESRTVLAHLRKATQGERHLRNTQPFSRELGGRMHLFAHNGDLASIEAQPWYAPGRFTPIGDTDSERAFCHLLAALEPLWQPGEDPPSVAARRQVVAEVAALLRPLGPANFLYTDGDVLFAHGHRRTQRDGVIAAPGLHVLRRTCTHAGRHDVADGLVVNTHDEDQRVTLVASVPLGEHPWEPLGEGEVLALRDGVLLD